MSLLAQVNQPNKDAYYFALDSSPVDPTVTAPRFMATGDNAGGGSFTAKSDDTTGAGEGVFDILSKASGNAQWSIGLSGVPAGANSGNNLAVFSYADDGSFLSAPIQIVRSTGGVIAQNGLNTSTLLTTGAASLDSVIVGDGTEAAGALAQINGTAGLSRVFDPIYNRPVPGPEVLCTTLDRNANLINLVPYTPAKTGLYTLTMEIRADTNGLSWTNGTSLIVGYLANQAPPFTLMSDSFVACDSLANPALFMLPSGFPTGVYVKDIVAVINLTAGTTVVPTATNNPSGLDLGVTGGIRFFIQPLIA